MLIKTTKTAHAQTTTAKTNQNHQKNRQNKRKDSPFGRFGKTSTSCLTLYNRHLKKEHATMGRQKHQSVFKVYTLLVYCDLDMDWFVFHCLIRFCLFCISWFHSLRSAYEYSFLKLHLVNYCI